MSQENTDATRTATDPLDSADEMDDASSAAEDTTQLRAQLDAANLLVADRNDAFLRARADYQNLKRRTDEEKEAMRALMNADLISRLLPIADNFERALRAAEQSRDFDKLVGGVNAVYRQINDLLSREGLEPIEAAGQAFDPNLHNAVLREETAQYPENTVIEELERGYMLNGKVLRPAMVKVASGHS
jgi:molecular chaperone GrpE